MHLTTEAGDPVAPVLFEEDTLGLSPSVSYPSPSQTRTMAVTTRYAPISVRSTRSTCSPRPTNACSRVAWRR